MPPVTDTTDDFPFPDDLSDNLTDLDHGAFDTALLQSALGLAARDGWHRFSLVEAARDAGLPVERVRRDYPFKHLLLITLGRLADESALRDDGASGTLRECLFDLLMRRLDVLQDYRDGLRAVMHAIPYDPALAALIGGATLRSMTWLADAAGMDCSGISGIVRLHALAATWAQTLRIWEKDTSPDLARTMAALDSALDRMERLGLLKPSARRKLDDAMNGSGLPDHELELELELKS